MKKKFTKDDYKIFAKKVFEIYIEKYNLSLNLLYSVSPRKYKLLIHDIAEEVNMSVGTAEQYSERLFNLFNKLNKFEFNNGLPSYPKGLIEQGENIFDKSKFDKSLINFESYQYDLEKSIKKSKKLTQEERLLRIERADKKPKKIKVSTVQYIRNADVIVNVLIRANGHCEKCGNKAPFIKKRNGKPYLEVHHKIWLSKGGEDTEKNSEALCPNCHRQKHYG